MLIPNLTPEQFIPLVITLVTIIVGAIVTIVNSRTPLQLEDRRAKREAEIEKTKLEQEASERLREAKSRTIAKIDDATSALLRELSYLHHKDAHTASAAANTRIPKLFSDLLLAYLEWENSIWAEIPVEDQAKVETLRQHVTTIVEQGLSNITIKSLTQQILILSRKATGRA